MFKMKKIYSKISKLLFLAIIILFSSLEISLKNSSNSYSSEVKIYKVSVEVSSVNAQTIPEECEDPNGCGSDPEEPVTTCTVSTSCGSSPHDYVKCSSSVGDCDRWGGVRVTCDGKDYFCN